MNNLLRTILLEWIERPLPKVISRDQALSLDESDLLKKALVVTGFRRVGKTYLVFDLIQRLLSQGLTRQQVVYLNFEDERITSETKILTQLIPGLQATFGQKPQFLFLDELQNIPAWSKWLRRILDSEEIKIVVTGSSSKMSSFEIPTELRGRAWERMVYPLSFKEFLRFKNQAVDFEKLEDLASEHAQFDFWFNEYLLWGGLPEVVLVPLSKKRELLQGYFQTVVRQDLIERFGLKNEEALKTLLKLLLNSTAITISKLYHSLKSLGLAVGKGTLNNYLGKIVSAYFLRELYYYSPSMRAQLQYPRKVYFIDNGFLTALSTQFSKNYGRLFENLVFWEFNKKKGLNEEIFYYQDQQKNEVDFILMQEGKVRTLYQVCFDVTDFETKEREVKNLLRAGKKLQCEDLRLITGVVREDLTNLKGVRVVTPAEFFAK